MEEFRFTELPYLLLTLGVEVEMDETLSIVTSIVNEMTISVERKFNRSNLVRNMEKSTHLVSEIINEIVDFIVHLPNKVNDSPLTSTEVQMLCNTNAQVSLTKADIPEEIQDSVGQDAMVLSQDPASRNLHEDFTEDPHQTTLNNRNFTTDNDPLSESSTEFEELWIKRKCEAEKCAEGRARVQFRQWQRDRTTLTQAIDSSLKEYIDMYEKAHALRLMFEEEKSQWSRKVMQVHAEDTPYGDCKRRRCDTEYAPVPPTWPYHQYHPRQSLDSEFQYTVDEPEDSNFEPQGASAGRGAVYGALDSTTVISPQRRHAKKFTVPMKHAQEE